MTCWTCQYQKNGGLTFLGVCSYFSKVRKEEDKEIPSAVVDNGCKNYVPRDYGELTIEDIERGQSVMNQLSGTWGLPPDKCLRILIDKISIRDFWTWKKAEAFAKHYIQECEGADNA